MDWTDIGWIKQLALPPGLLLLVALVALACRGRAARLWSAAAILALTVAAMPVTDRIASTASTVRSGVGKDIQR